MSVQIVVDEAAPGEPCGGLPPVVRGMHRAAAELPGSRVVVDRTSRLAIDWPIQTEQARLDAGALKPALPLLALAGDGFLEEGESAALAASPVPAAGLCRGRVVAVYLPEAGALASLAPSAAARAALRAPAARVELRWTPCENAEQARAAEDALCARLAKDTDGYLAKHDRKLSISLSRRMLPFAISPNAITTASLVLALLGCWWLASGERLWQAAGVLFLWGCCILDGCDGEVARLKLCGSPAGAAYDLWIDHVTHAATFVAIVVGVRRARPELELLIPGVLLATGVLGCMFAVWRLVLRVPEARRSPYAALFERLASRDYVYLVAGLVLIGKLEWFVWAAAVGSHAFYAALWAANQGLRLRPLPTA